jgi:hypothetical protein
MGYLDKALEMMQKQGSGTINTNLIETTLREIGKEYRPGALEWIRINRPEEWARMLTLEEGINQAALSRDMENLKQSLSNYQELILGVVEVFETPRGQTGNLFWL